MEIFHHISFNINSFEEFKNALINLGILLILPKEGGEVAAFDISESDSLWEEVYKLLKKYRGFDIYRSGDIYYTNFSEDEIRNAEWLRLIPSFEQGYPQPKGNWPIKQSSLINVCPKCATYEQNNPMRLYKEPSLGKNSFFSLIGLGELFATSEVFLNLENIEAKGYEGWDAIIHKTKQPSGKVKQLFVPKIAEPGLLETQEMRQVQCPVCDKVKYYSHMKGIMYINRNAIQPDLDFILTNEWFGAGYIAFRGILVSNRVARLILDNGWMGVQLKVVELV